MLWILKMLIETPRAVLEYRRDYYNSKKIRATIKREGVVAGFHHHDRLYGSTIEEWMAVCEYINDAGKEIPEGLINMALEKGWISLKEPPRQEPDNSWREWENE